MSTSTKKQNSTKSVELNLTVLGTENSVSVPVPVPVPVPIKVKKPVSPETQLFFDSFKVFLIQYTLDNFSDFSKTFNIERSKYSLLFSFCEANNFTFKKFSKDKRINQNLPKGNIFLNDGTIYHEYNDKVNTEKLPVFIEGTQVGFIQYDSNLFTYFPLKEFEGKTISKNLLKEVRLRTQSETQSITIKQDSKI